MTNGHHEAAGQNDTRKRLHPAVAIGLSMAMSAAGAYSWWDGSLCCGKDLGQWLPALIDAYLLWVLVIAAVQSDARKPNFFDCFLPSRLVGLIMVTLFFVTHLLVFAGTYRALGVSFYKNNASAALDQLDSLYFSVVTLATVGYGDITPADPVAKKFVMFEIISGMILLVAIVSLLISRISGFGVRTRADH